MMSIILTSIFFFSICFFKMINPLALGLILVFQTLITAIFLGSMTKTFWIMYLLMLTFIGGMLVLFIYVTSIFPNEKFSFNQNSYFLFFLLLIIFSVLLIYSMIFNLNLSWIDQTYNLPEMNMSLNYTNKMFFSQTSLILIFLVNYLFYCMIVVIKITNFHKGPLRKMTYV